MKTIRIVVVVIAGIQILGFMSRGSATIVDLTPGAGSSGTINGAIFTFDSLQPAGTGVLDPFLRVQGSSTQEGYNTSNGSVPFDDKPGVWTHDLQFWTLVPSSGYYHFVLDINEPNGGSSALLSMDKLQIYVSSVGSQNTTVLSSLGTLVYDLDAGGDSAVYMDYNNAPGSGVSDVKISVPASVFSGVTALQYIILYARMGDTYASADGFEEWSALNESGIPPVLTPEPSSLILLGLGGTALAICHRRRKWAHQPAA